MSYFENAAHAFSTMGFGGIAALVVFGLLFVVVYGLAFMDLFGSVQGFHHLQLAYMISREDIEKLTRKEMRKTKRMSYNELKAFLTERFPNSTPAIAKEL